MGRSEIDEAGVERSHRALQAARVSERFEFPRVFRKKEGA